MDSGMKFGHKQQSDAISKGKIEEKIPYRLCFKDRVKDTDTSLIEEKRTSQRFYDQERLQSRKVLRLTRVHSVEAVQTNSFHGDDSTIRLTKRIPSVERRTIPPSLYLPYLLVNKDAYITPVFNMATYKGFRTQEERKRLSLSKQLERYQKNLLHEGNSEEKCSAVPAVIDISKPAKLNVR